jgi:hypothetical protein
MSSIEASFDEYRAQLTSKMHNKVDADLAMKIMYLERKLPDVEPKVDLDIKVKNEATALLLKDEVAIKFGFQTSCHKNHIIASGRTNVERLAKIASHSAIEWISGNATPASY